MQVAPEANSTPRACSLNAAIGSIDPEAPVANPAVVVRPSRAGPILLLIIALSSLRRKPLLLVLLRLVSRDSPYTKSSTLK